MWVATTDLPRSAAHPFYHRLNRILADAGFDAFVEAACAPFYAPVLGRPSLAPGRYFRLLLLGYFEGLDSERGIAWRAADSLSVRSFLDLELHDPAPDHSTISRTRRLIDLETHAAVFTWMLQRLADAGLVQGQTIGIDATTLCRLAQPCAGTPANAMRLTRETLGHRERARWRAWIAGLQRRLDAPAGSGCPDHEDEGADASRARGGSGDRRCDSSRRMPGTRRHWLRPSSRPRSRSRRCSRRPTPYASWLATRGITAIRCWSGGGRRARLPLGTRSRTAELKAAAYRNRRRIRGARGQRLLRQRGERLERPFAHLYETCAVCICAGMPTC